MPLDNELYKVLFEQSPHAIIVIDPETLLPVIFNDRVLELLGYTRDAFRTIRMADCETSAAGAAAEDSLSEILKYGSGDCDTLLRTGMGQVKNVRVIVRTMEVAGQRCFQMVISDIARRKLAEKELRESEARYRQVYESMREAFAVVDMTGRIIESNQAYQEMIGYSRDELSHLTYNDLTPARWHAMEARLIRDEVLRQGYSTVYEKEYYHKDGTIFPVELRTFLIRNREGGPEAMWALVRDITERKDAEITLKSALTEAQRFREALDHVSAYIYMKDPQSRYVYANRPTLELFGCSAEELVGCDDTRFFPPATVKRLQDVDARVFLGEQTTEEIDVDDAKGGRRVYWEVKTPIYAEPGSTTAWGLLGVSTDITQRKLMEEALRSQADLLDLTHDSIIVRDLEDRITFWNRGATMQYGWTAQDAVGKVTHELLATVFPVPLDEIKKRLFLAGYWEGELTHARRDGSLVTVASRWALQEGTDGTPRAIMETNNDITDKLKLEEQERTVQKLESVGILAGGIAHDFNNLLSVILGNISLAKIHGQAGVKFNDELTRAEEACEHAAELSRRLLTFSKGGVPVRRDVQVAGLVRDAVEFALVGSHVLAEFSFPERLPSLTIDERQMRQVFSNLAINAREAMPDGGRLSVVAEQLVLTEQNPFSLPAGQYLIITFRDQGVGIPHALIGRIFDPYFSTKEMGSRKGQGLGLTICHSIVTKHGGAITVESKPGEGSAFTVLLPAADLRVPAIEATKEA